MGMKMPGQSVTERHCLVKAGREGGMSKSIRKSEDLPGIQILLQMVCLTIFKR